jgi:hypothetical protein
MDINFEQLLNQITNDVVALVSQSADKYVKEAKADAQKLLDDMKDSLARWIKLLASGAITKKDFEYLVLGQKELIELNLLKQAGLTLIQIDELKNGILNSIVKTVSSIF